MSNIETLFQHAPVGTTEIVQSTVTSALSWAIHSSVWDSVKKEWRPRKNQWQSIATRPQPHFKATRENLEKIAKDAKCDFVEIGEPKWTHGIPPKENYYRVNHGGGFVNCYLIGRDDMGAFVYRIDDQYYSTMSESNFKPNKPTITKDLAWDLIVDGCKVEWITSKYEMVE